MDVRAAPSTKGRFCYLDAGVTSSLVANGRVRTQRDADGGDAGTEGVVADERLVDIADARRLERAPTLDQEGFAVVARPLERELDFYDHRQVVEAYYSSCRGLIAEVTGAPHVFAFDHNVRSATQQQAAERIRGGQRVQGPAHVVHGDYTLTSAPRRLEQLTQPPTGNDTLRSMLADGEVLIDPELAARALAPTGRFALINVWRNIAPEPVVTHPLALCDARTVEPEDLVVFEIHYADRVGENYFAKAALRHRWIYWSGLTRDEGLLIKQWDSAGALARSEGKVSDSAEPDSPSSFSFHSAFDDPATPVGAPDRRSIEVRCIALWPAAR
ncbi:MAG: CmcJ/NvfI family oxidoreductase [Myxococcota bacterium]